MASGESPPPSPVNLLTQPSSIPPRFNAWLYYQEKDRAIGEPRVRSGFPLNQVETLRGVVGNHQATSAVACPPLSRRLSSPRYTRAFKLGARNFDASTNASLRARAPALRVLYFARSAWRDLAAATRSICPTR